MEIIKQTTDRAEIRLSEKEIFAVRQAFFVTHYNSKIDNFEQTIGVSKKEVKELMLYFQDIRERIKLNSIPQSILNNPKTPIKRKNCNLRSQKYDLCFYIQKIFPKVEKLHFLIALQKKGTKESVVKTVWDTISVNQVREDLALFKDKTNLELRQEDQISVSLFNGAIKIKISNSKSKESALTEESPLDVEFTFPEGIQVSQVDLGEGSETKNENPFNTPRSFNSTLTLKNITNFIIKVEDFFENRENHNLN